MHRDQFRELLRRYADGTCTQQERCYLEDMVLRNPIANKWAWGSEEEKILTGLRIKFAIDERRMRKRQARMRKLWYIGIAASLLIAVGVSMQLFFQWNRSDSGSVVISETAPFRSDRIRLTLADGSMVSLDSIGEGLISGTGNVRIRKLASGELIYDMVDKGSSAIEEKPLPQHTLHVPNGRQLQLTLPDGTRVWMNTASSLTYPAAFAGNERKVKLSGEAYFEVATDLAKPFKVMVNDTEITVTGTQFNVSAYASDRSVKATLMEGGIDVQHGGNKVSLAPGYQAIMSEGGTIEKRKGNLEQALAWKNGYFVFDDMDIISVMRCVARWYDIQVEVTDQVPSKRFGGTFPITGELDELLTDLEMIGKIKFERKGKEVRIMP